MFAVRLLIRTLALAGAILAALALVPTQWLPPSLENYVYTVVGERSWQAPPGSRTPESGPPVDPCPDGDAARREKTTIDGVTVGASPVCEPDDPHAVAAFVKGTNRVSRDTLLRSELAPDAVEKEEDIDGDGDPDIVRLRLEVVELNGRSPETGELLPQYAIAPGIRPTFWVFAPKVRGMATRSLEDLRAHPLLRTPSPAIRIEAGDRMEIVLENTHYMPHTIHLHGVDHPFTDSEGEGNDGVPQTSERPVMPGERRIYEVAPRRPGTFFYHCHVQPQAHILMGLQGLLVVEENRPDNPVQTLNVGAGRVRHPSGAVREGYDREYDLHYEDVDRELHELVREANDPRLVAEATNRRYDVTERTADYFLVNGRSFPYSFRDALVVVGRDEEVKLRVLNGGLEGVSLHTHGHKARITHRDGVEDPAGPLRDVVWLSAAQRLDLRLRTVDDGLHAYGPGIWLLHDHREAAVTTDGMNPGGDLSAIVYESHLGPDGWPKTQGVAWDTFFDPRYYRGELPVWEDGSLLGEAEARPPDSLRVAAAGFLGGLVLGGLVGRRRRRVR